jgi:hypothetical protein
LKKSGKRQSGAITIEACIIGTLFILLFLFLNSFFVVFTAQNDISHALMQTSQSLSFDTYYTEKFEKGVRSDKGTNSPADIASFFGHLFNISGDNIYYTPDFRWHDPAVPKDQFLEVVENRFLGYFAEGDENLAANKLSRYNIENNWSGMDFSESKVENGSIVVTVKYRMQYQFNFFNLAKPELEQTSCSGLWN